MSTGAVLEKIGKIEKELQKLKVDFLLRLPEQKRGGRYSDKEIVREVKKARKQIWNEKYSRRI
ncbi:hypothetical protein A3H65_01320 [Candidatus Giovannonibacteria bacterium RIFCSPLOWO2_02_FULL_45_14]|uniref:Uncharacterized protein n=1 Tax=Candidatus Giovannonibacteria bacterium RIFCSPLOWO2_12_FULL_44_15 TaxID=1798364 RepID=A0A1F5Y0P5_9BACT|nr:MAG: hypothetical protein A3C75_00910 [Candidatus Giovannonibacteria bacterium RIFCSPHIGHO2_02_FULL_44_31]OGF76419.1 MAG: hypothetical protein A3E62_00890 [Candidatus Giovannonibacteria bacterium RIFCSPHIGHO2_12_FULL_44_29]OGF91091.1 MAG: hypothetical protein A3H65_01320 [Candidatus Giovannonibacteria bacterium RIFCSPLOWO2_02_FULL_45_14]OGF93788.1 MAG: hypothetical protein A3G54_02685 [Candidatus Giovannonibacteria bacterium RIFCSPLOWO2_12_FULL_44_15]